MSVRSTRGVADAPAETGEGATDLSLDVVYEILSNERRRRTLRYLLSAPEGVTLGEIAEHLASAENDKPVAALSSAERKRVYVCLYQCHLPKLDDADVVDFDDDRKTVEAGANIGLVMDFLPESRDDAGGGWTDTVADFVRSVGGWIR